MSRIREVPTDWPAILVVGVILVITSAPCIILVAAAVKYLFS